MGTSKKPGPLRPQKPALPTSRGLLRETALILDRVGRTNPLAPVIAVTAGAAEGVVTTLDRLPTLCFPLKIRVKAFNWNYGAFRAPERFHAGCDLMVKKDTAVLAMQSGAVLKYEPDFWVLTPGRHRVERMLDGTWGRRDAKGKLTKVKTVEKKGVTYFVFDATHEYREDEFFRTHAVTVRHDNFYDYSMPVFRRERLPEFLVRYAEITVEEKFWKTGAPVAWGEQLGAVAAQPVASMLHLEMYTGSRKGKLTTGRSPSASRGARVDPARMTQAEIAARMQRREDVTDPTPYLQVAVLKATPKKG